MIDNKDLIPEADESDYEFVDHPPHYNQHPKGIECIDVIEDFQSPNLATAVKHIWRAGLKPGADDVQDLKKAAWYLNREISRIQGGVTQ